MTWTYSASSLGLDRNKVRFMIGDTNTNLQQLDDAEIDYVLTVETSPTLAAAVCCDALAAKYSVQTDFSNGALSASASQRAAAYRKLADRLRAGGAGSIPGDSVVPLSGMYVGGQSVSAKGDLTANSDNVKPSFSIGMDDLSSTSGSSQGF